MVSLFNKRFPTLFMIMIIAAVFFRIRLYPKSNPLIMKLVGLLFFLSIAVPVNAETAQ